MTTDDILSDYVGAKLSGMEIKDAPSTEEGLYCHDVQFLEVQTDRGSFTMSSRMSTTASMQATVNESDS